jgi:phosphonatase-like hydrolase
MKIKAVVFDMAGTTVNEDNLVYKTLRSALNEHGVNVSLEAVLLHGAGKEKFQAINDIISNCNFEIDEVLKVEIFNYFLIQLKLAYNNFKVEPMPGAELVFSALKNLHIKVVLNTGYDSNTANALLGQLGWEVGNQIDLLVTASDVLNNRPLPDMILLAKEKLGIADTKEIIKIGDSCVDIEEGKNANCLYSIGITTGAQTKIQLQAAKPNFIFNDLTELLDIIK